MFETATFEPEPGQVGAARRFVRCALRDVSGITEDMRERLVLAANELVTNAVLHARTSYEVSVVCADGWVCIEVADGNTRMPQQCLTPTDATSGRGLGIVDALGLSWAVRRNPHGKSVCLTAELS